MLSLLDGDCYGSADEIRLFWLWNVSDGLIGERKYRCFVRTSQECDGRERRFPAAVVLERCLDRLLHRRIVACYGNPVYTDCTSYASAVVLSQVPPLGIARRLLTTYAGVGVWGVASRHQTLTAFQKWNIFLTACPFAQRPALVRQITVFIQWQDHRMHVCHGRHTCRGALISQLHLAI